MQGSGDGVVCATIYFDSGDSQSTYSWGFGFWYSKLLTVEQAGFTEDSQPYFTSFQYTVQENTSPRTHEFRCNALYNLDNPLKTSRARIALCHVFFASTRPSPLLCAAATSPLLY
eukprot:685523-Pleurochrysis_carterae.AAC.2